MKSLIKKIISFTSTISLIWSFAACSVDATDSKSEPSPKQTVATPVFTVESGEVTSGTTVEITCSTEGAAIYYTTDGSVPTAESTRYINSISIEQSITIKAIAIKNGMRDSSIAGATYTAIVLLPKLTAPTASVGFKTEPSTEKFQHSVLVEYGFNSNSYLRNEIGSGTVITLSSTEGATIYYTIDGSEPTTENNIYTQPVEISKKCTLRAIAIKKGYIDSESISVAIEKPYKRNLTQNNRLSFEDLFVHGNALSGLFIIYEATEDFTGPDFSKQHYLFKIDHISHPGFISFDTYDTENYFDALGLEYDTIPTNNYVTCNGTFKGNLWIKEIFICDDSEIFGSQN